jgi:hypothetical protein
MNPVVVKKIVASVYSVKSLYQDSRPDKTASGCGTIFLFAKGPAGE